MNLAAYMGDHDSPLICANFNQDSTTLAVGTKTGCRLYSLAHIDTTLEQTYETKRERDLEEICIVQRFFSSGLIALVSLSSPRKLKMYHIKKNTEICNYSYSNTILSVKLNRRCLVVCLEESIYLHNIEDMKLTHTIQSVPPNPTGLCALSVSQNNNYLAYPGSTRTGEVFIYDTFNLKPVNQFTAHDSPLAAICFNASATRLATASERGTVIRVFLAPAGERIFEFRRGMKRCVQISSLAFLAEGHVLAASSNTETVHVFRLLTEAEREEAAAAAASSTSAGSPRHHDDQTNAWVSYFQDALKTSATYLPTQVSDMLHQERDFATAKLPSGGMRNVCTVTIVQKQPRLLVASQDGYLYVFGVDLTHGGECSLIKQYRIDGGSNDPPSGPTVNATVQTNSTHSGGNGGAGSTAGTPPHHGGNNKSYATALRGESGAASPKTIPESIPYRDPLVGDELLASAAGLSLIDDQPDFGSLPHE